MQYGGNFTEGVNMTIRDEGGLNRRKVLLALLGSVLIAGACVRYGLSGGDSMSSIVLAVLGLLAYAGILGSRTEEPDMDRFAADVRNDGLGYWRQQLILRGLQSRLYIPPRLAVIRPGHTNEVAFTFVKPAWSQTQFSAKIATLLVAQGIRRAVVYGRGGSGKSLLALMGMIGMFEQPGTLVPLLLSLNSWRASESFESWINRRLVSTYPSTRVLSPRSPGGRVGRLVRSGKFMVVLDGFDELPPAFQQDALGQINGFFMPTDPLVVLTRQMNAGLDETLAVPGAMHIGVDDHEPARIGEYLKSLPDKDAVVHQLADRVLTDEHDPIAKILARPLYLELTVDALLDGRLTLPQLDAVIAAGGVHAGEQYLLSLKIDDTLAQPDVPGGPRAGLWLTYMARQMSRNDVGAFAWYHTVGLAPAPILAVAAALTMIPAYKIALTMPVGLTRGLAIGLFAGTCIGLMRGVRSGPIAAASAFLVAWLAVAAVGLLTVPAAQTIADATEIALAAGLTTLVKDRLMTAAGPHIEMPVRLRAWSIATTLIVAMAVVVAAATKAVSAAMHFDDPNRGFAAIIIAVVAGVGVAVVASRVLVHDPRFVQPSTVLLTMRRRRGGVLRPLRSGLIAATAIGIGGGLGGAVRFGAEYGLALIIIFGLAIGVPVGIVGGAIKWLSAPPAKGGQHAVYSPMRNDRLTAIGIVLAISAAAIAGIVTLTGAPLASLNTALQQHSGMALLVVPLDGVLFGLTIGVVVACYYSAWFAFSVSHAYLALLGRLPWRLFRFLEALEEHELLRREGLVYQFRNIEMQDHLTGLKK